MDELKKNIIDSTIDLCIPCNPTGLETTTGDTEQTVDSDEKINLGGAYSDSGIDDSTPNDATNNTDDNYDAAINKAKDENKAKDATAVLKLLRLHSVISAKTKYDACAACITFLKSGKFEDENISCVNGECPTCRFDKIWSKGLRRRILIR